MPTTSDNLIEKLRVAGDAAVPFEEVWRAIWKQPHVPAATLELCRLNLARLHRAEAELKLRMPLPSGSKISDEKIAGLLRENWMKDPLFTETERAVLNFTEWYHVNPQGIPDDVANRVIEHLGPSGFIALIEALGFIDGRIRVALIYSRMQD
jgi:alkylhydroperoxidase family enzyme